MQVKFYCQPFLFALLGIVMIVELGGITVGLSQTTELDIALKRVDISSGNGGILKIFEGDKLRFTSWMKISGSLSQYHTVLWRLSYRQRGSIALWKVFQEQDITTNIIKAQGKEVSIVSEEFNTTTLAGHWEFKIEIELWEQNPQTRMKSRSSDANPNNDYMVKSLVIRSNREQPNLRCESDGGVINSTPAIIPEDDSDKSVTVYLGTDLGKLLKKKITRNSCDNIASWPADATTIGMIRSPILLRIVGTTRTIYFGSDDGKVHSIKEKDALTLEKAGESSIGKPVRALRLNSYKRILYIGADDGKVRKLEISDDGKFSCGWTVPKEYQYGIIRANPVLSKDEATLYVPSDDGKLYALNTSDGKEKWKFSTAAFIRSSPIVSKGGIYFGSGDGYFYIVKDLGGQALEQCRFPAGAPIKATPTEGPDGTIYFGADNGVFYAITPSCHEKWRFYTYGPIDWEAELLSRGEGNLETIFVGSHDGNIYALSPYGELKYVLPLPMKGPAENPSFSTLSTKPIVRVGPIGPTLFVGSTDGNLYVFKVE